MKPTPTVAKLLTFLERSGYEVMDDAFFFREYIRILKLLPNPGIVLNEKEL